MKPETAGKIKYGVWGLIVGAVIAMIIGFAWGGWKTSGTSKEMADEAVLASQAAICVAQFMKDPSHEEKFKEFKELSTYQRAQFIEKGGALDSTEVVEAVSACRVAISRKTWQKKISANNQLALAA